MSSGSYSLCSPRASRAWHIQSSVLASVIIAALPGGACFLYFCTIRVCPKVAFLFLSNGSKVGQQRLSKEPFCTMLDLMDNCVSSCLLKLCVLGGGE